MTKASSKRQLVIWNMHSKQQHAALAYVQQAVHNRNEQCGKQQQQQQQHKQLYSYIQ